MTNTMKIVIPMAGWGTRMRPHTWSKPKPLVSVAGKTSLEHLMDMFSSIPAEFEVEYVFITGPYLGEMQIPPFVAAHYPGLKYCTVVQQEMKGQSHALLTAAEHLSGPMLMCFSDTLMETDFSFLSAELSDCVAWVKPVPDPRRFGVAEVDPQGWVTRFIEKPQSIDNNLVVVGCYYFRSAEQLLAAIQEQIARGLALKHEYFLTDAISLMIAGGARVRTQHVDIWLDTGTIDATLDTNRFLLEHGRRNDPGPLAETNTIIQPVFIHPEAAVRHSTIGPYASIGAGCRIEHSRIEDSILEDGVTVAHAALVHSLVGRQAAISGKGTELPLQVNIGDNSRIEM